MSFIFNFQGRDCVETFINYSAIVSQGPNALDEGKQPCQRARTRRDMCILCISIVGDVGEESKSLINHDFRDKRHTIRFLSQLPFLILSVSLWRPGQTETTTVNPRHRFSGRRG